MTCLKFKYSLDRSIVETFPYNTDDHFLLEYFPIKFSRLSAVNSRSKKTTDQFKLKMGMSFLE